MLPHEVLQDESKLHQLNAGVLYHINTGDVSSLSLRPHSRQFPVSAKPSSVPGSIHQPARPNAFRQGPAAAEPKRLGTSSGTRQSSPGRGRAAGHAVINPSTVLTSSVATAIADHNQQIARMQHPSPQRQRGASPTQKHSNTQTGSTDANTAALPAALAGELHSGTPLRVAGGTEDFLTPNSKTGRSMIHHHLDNMASTALVGLVGMGRLRESYQTTADDTLTADAAFLSNGGCKVGDLQTATVISVDLKRLDLGVSVPTNTITTLRPPICSVSLGDYPHGLLQVDITDIDQTGSNNHPFRFERVVFQLIGVQEMDMDRCLRYDVVPEIPAMFVEQPHIVTETGDLIFTANPIATGRTSCKVTLVDCASVDPASGSCLSSAPVHLTIEVLRTKNILAAGKTQQLSTHSGSKICTVPNFLADTTIGSLNDGAGSSSAPSSPLVESVSRNVAFSFPPSSAHTLRREEIVRQHNEFVILGAPSSATLLRQRSVCFHSPLDLLELLRFSTSVAERDRIAGEPVEGDRQQFEQRLLDRIREDERSKGHTAVDLCPLLLRLAQVVITAADPRRHGDAVEHLDRICRIRAQHVITNPHSGDPAIAGTEDSNNTHHVASDDLGMHFRAGSKDSSKKQHEALLQSYMMAATFLKDIGRYREALEFAQQGARVADAAFGDTSVEYLRISLLISTLLHLLGDRHAALKSLEVSVGRAEVLLGKDGHATMVVLHLLGVLHMYEGEFTKALSLHERALFQRQQASQMDPVLIAESLALTAYTRALCGVNVSNKAKINTALENALLLVNNAPPLSGSSGDLHKCTVLTIAAKATALHGTSKDYEAAIRLLQRASDIAAKVRGFASAECAVFSMEVVAMRIASGTSTPSTVSELALVHNAFSNSLGPQHPFTCRAAVLTAELRMPQVPQASRDQALRALHFLRQQRSPLHRDIGVVADVISRIYASLRDAKLQLQYARYAYDIAAQHFTPAPMMKVLETRLIGAFSAARVAPPRSFFVSLENRAADVRDNVGESSAENIEPLQNLGEAMLLNGDFERAHHVFTKALKIADSVNFIFLLGHLFKPAAQLSINDLQERNRIAGDRINTALAFSFATILYQIAVVFECQGQSEDAQSTYLQALAALEISGLVVGDSISEVIFSLAKLLYCEGHYGDALAYAEKGYNLVLDNAALRTSVNVADASALMHVILQRLAESGYSLVRHHDSRHRFTSYV
jgi:tetratricopeptide (TPR) repeat protein